MQETTFDARFQAAVKLFETGAYKSAFEDFVELYRQGRQDQILDLLTQAYYAPNEQELRAQYQNNVARMGRYPYCFAPDFPAFEDLPFALYPVEDGVFYIFNKAERKFTKLYQPEEKMQPPHYFANLSKPLLVENEQSHYCLRYLNDVVRASEDFAGDNHVYLYYERAEDLAVMMSAADLAPLLEQNKFVFLIGEQNKARYPINFKKQFGIDYKSMKAQPLRVEELNRICFWYKHAHSGTVFSLGVLGANDHTIVWGGHTVNTYSTLRGKDMYFSKEFQSSMRDVDKEYTADEIIEICHSEGTKICLPDTEGFLAWLKGCAGDGPRTVGFLFRAYFLYLYQQSHKVCRARIAPIIVFDPHMWDSSVYQPLVESFPYHVTLTCMREPIRTFASCYWRGLVVWDKFQTQFVLASDYTYATFLSDALRKCYFGYRFEDLKLHPAQMCKSICRLLNIPYMPKMITAEAAYQGNDGKVVRGFETTALNRDMESVFSEFDRARLQIFYEPIHKYYGYPAFDSEEYPLSDEDIDKLFDYPFRFERRYREIYGDNGPDEAALRQWIKQVLNLRLSKQPQEQMVFPKLLRPEE